METTKHAVLWIDHHQANLLMIGPEPTPSRHLTAHRHATAQHGSAVRTEHEFFAEVCAALAGIEAVLVTGSKTALADFRHYVEKHRPQTRGSIAGYEAIDHQTDRQLAALARRFFDLRSGLAAH